MTTKVHALIGNTEILPRYGNVFRREPLRGVERLRVDLDAGHNSCIRTLLGMLHGSFQLLYVLHTTRIDAELGRYESPELNKSDVTEFIDHFGEFLGEDARHDFWIRAHDDDATLVWDRHNAIYAYGPLDVFERTLQEAGVKPAHVPDIAHGPHAHHYHPRWDDAEREILRYFEWCVKPLRESDIQFRESDR